ncbi:hypothetical protein EUTSA_v10027707mg [Eutrema salsugineum]|uniref:Leucine-rich repeat-containing N-terminal plant-type domain-containing protein n=1 Tax=Eutrema salsugineum TaxID=72664 RepID=V4NKY8_EUTSA|nr:receptor-like protein 9DC3 [Eutrema salsugineum]ESQ47031.1 hypothetical protein EUTSA_v10027707mg [Eutrema salsugineum]
MQKPCLLSWFLFFFLPQLSFSCQPDQRQSLLEFKNCLTQSIKNQSTTKINLAGLKKWKQNSDCCKWKLVRCNAHSPSREVIELNLSSLVVSGSVSSSVLRPILRIISLEALDVSSNFIQGEIPGDGFVNLTRLISLDMSDNAFNGSIPPSLFQPQNLSVLALSRNNFTGKIPDTIGETSVIVLTLSENNLSGSVPKSISKNSRLMLLDLSKNRLSGEFPRFNLNSNLQLLDISFNEFSGDVPASFGSYTRFLKMDHNNFSGEFPQDFTTCPLKHLDLQDNKISGKFPSFISRLFPALEVFIMRNNSLEGSIPEDISNLTGLKILDLSENNLDGPIPSSLGNLRAMSQSPIYVYYDFYTGPGFSVEMGEYLHIPDFVVNWKNSKQGIAHRNSHLYTILDLSKNSFFGEIPPSLGNLIRLKVLNLSHNNISGLIPQSFGDLEELEVLDLSYNNLSGHIPQTFSKLGELTTLGLSHNKLSGIIPKGPQLDRLNDPNIYAGNNNICGEQIQVSCFTQAEQPEEDKEENVEEDEEETMFSWKAAVIGYPCGFLIAVLFMYLF